LDVIKQLESIILRGEEGPIKEKAMYGGRVTDSWDRRILMTYLEEYMGDFLFDKNREFFFSKPKYKMPSQLNLEGFINTANEIPLTNSPVVFGLHPNAEITYFTNSAKSLWTNLLSMQVSSAASSTGVNREEYIQGVANDVIMKLPEHPWDIAALRADAGLDISPTTVVLFQELERFNKLIDKIKDTLINLKRALKGEIGMSSELDELAASLFNGFLPSKWAKLAPQTEKNLGAWMDHFSNRIKQYNSWVKNGEPAVIWLSGLHIPESYLTALVQTSCRLKGWALDKSTLYSAMTKSKNPDEFKKKPEHGCYVKGLYL
jgi:dynein heavy chain